MQDMEKLYHQYFQTVYRYIFCLTQDADSAEEITQEVFYQALKSLRNFRGECKISVWLCQIGKHIWINEHKRKRRYDHRSIDAYIPTLAAKEDVEKAVIDRENKAALYAAIQGLDEKTREVMLLRILGEFSFHEIGEMLGKKETWARVTFYRGKQKIMKEGLG